MGSAGGNGDGRHPVYRDLPDVSTALQYSAGHRGVAGQVVMATLWGKDAPIPGISGLFASAHHSGLRCPAWSGKTHQ